MKVLFLNTLYAPHIGGGAEIILKSLVEGIAMRGHDVTILTTGPLPGVQKEKINGVTVLRVGIKNIYWHYRKTKPQAWQRALWHLFDIYNPAMAKIVETIVREIKPDVVNCHNLAGFSVSTLMAIKRTGTPVLQVLHDLYHLCPNSNMFRNGKSCEQQCFHCRMFRLPHAKASMHVDAVVGVSQYVLQRHLVHGLFGNATIKTAILNAREIKASRREGSARTGMVTFGFIGTLTQAKGVELLIKAFKAIHPENRVQLLIAGTGSKPYETELKQHQSNNIRFLGYVKTEEFYPLIDVLIVPSIWQEALGMVVIEAFAHGIPVIGSRRGGIPEIIEDGVNGYLFDPENNEELVRLLEFTMNNHEGIERMRKNAREASLKFSDSKQWIVNYENVMLKISNNS
jgi:glycosyltransferase involved in cell wall biosynthesis